MKRRKADTESGGGMHRELLPQAGQGFALECRKLLPEGSVERAHQLGAMQGHRVRSDDRGGREEGRRAPMGAFGEI